MIKNFTHLHVHTTYSILDGISRREDLAKKAKEYGQTALAVTDHGNVFNAISFYKTCKDVNIKPIIGTEFYVAPDSRFGRTYATKAKASEDAENGDISYHAYHLTVLARNRQGYENLKKLSTISYREGFYKKPRIDLEVLTQHKEGLIVMSGCLASITSRYIVAGQKDKAIEVIDKMRAIHGENFFLELMYHGIGQEEDVVNEALIDISNRHGVPLVMTNDSHFTAKGDETAHEVALCVGTNKTLADPSHWRFNGEGYWFKTADEMAHVASLASIPESALSNTELINSMVEDYGFKLTSNKHPAQIPLFRIESGDALSEQACIQLLELKAWQGLAERGLADSKVHQERLMFELDMIKRKNFSSYFLIIADIIDGAMRKRGILPPIGRGSSMGSLVCYCLYIIGMDPVVHDVPFERFINEGRKDLPDIDTDISQEHRKEVIDYIVSRYGQERVAQIVTFQSMAAKAAIDNVGRALGVPSAVRRQVSKLLGDDVTKDDHVRELVESVDRAKQIMEQTPGWIDISEKLEGNNKNLGAHAAGIVISNDPIEEHVPLIRDSAEGHRVTQYDMKDIAELGLLKLDMLGLKTMDLIQYTLELIERRHGIKLDYQGFPLDDATTFHNVANGKYVSVFQYDSSGIRTAARQLYPTEFNHLVALNALYRPGPMLKIGKELSIMEHYFERRHGREPVEIWHPSLEEVFRPTLGLCILQEQIMSIASIIGGFNETEADDYRSAIGKKDKVKFEAVQQKLRERGMQNGHSAEFMEGLTAKLAGSARYNWNKGHCLKEGTKVLTCERGWVDIQEVKAGEEIWSVRHHDGELFRNRVVDVIYNGIKPVCTITAAGKQITCTNNHLIMVRPGEYESADNINDLNSVLMYGNTDGGGDTFSADVQGKAQENESVPVWDLEMEQDPNFIANGFVVHNSIAYSYISYVTAYLETHFPYEYYTVLLNVNLDDNDQLKILLSSIIQKGIKVLPPHINNSRSEFYTDGDAIYMGIFSVRMAGDTAVEAILKERDQNGAFKDFVDFCMRMSQYTRCNKTVKENLIKAGAFNWDTSITNKNKFENVELIQKIIKKFEGKVSNDLIRDQIMDKIVVDGKDWDQQESLAHERAVLNFYISSHPVMQFQPLFNLFPELNMIVPSQLQEQQVGTRVVIAGVVEAREMKTTKKGDPFLRMRVGDQMGSIEVMVWSPLATQVYNRVPDNSMALITGTIQEDKFRLGENTIYVNGVIPISNGIPINSYYAADVPTANTVAMQIGGDIATLSDQIMNMGHVVMLKNIAFIKPNDFAGLRPLRARYQING